MTPMELSLPDHPALAVLPDAPTRADIEAFGQFLQSLEADHVGPDIHTRHHFAGEVYGRSIVLGAECFLVGLPHKHDHLNVCVGDITVWTEQGKVRYTGAHIIESKAGCMRVGFAHAETTWLTVHRNATGGRDLEQIEDSLIEQADLLLTRRQAALEADRADYQVFLAEHGFTEPFVRSIVEDMRDHAEMPPGFDAFEVRASPIQGVGLFATRDLNAGETVAPARIGPRRTVAGRRTNHAKNPNCIFVQAPGGGLDLVTAQPVAKGTELTIDYRQAGRVNGSRPQAERISP